MKAYVFTVGLTFCLVTGLSVAQSEPAATVVEKPTTLTTSTTSATQPDMSDLFNKVNSVAEELQLNLSDLEKNIQESRNSIEKGAQILDEMLVSVRKVHQGMAEESEIWQELSALLDLWEQRRNAALQKSESNPAFLPIAKAWEDKLKTAKGLQRQISTERANSVALMRSIEADRDIVLSYYELGQADKAIESLQKVSTNLANLNNNIQNIVKVAGSIDRQQPIPQ